MIKPRMTIFPTVLVAPPITCDDDEANHYVKRLMELKVALDSKEIGVYLSGNSVHVLSKDGLYPIRPNLKFFFATHKIEEYDFNTVAKLVDRLLTMTPCFEDHFQLEDILLKSVKTLPDAIVDTVHPTLKFELGRVIAWISILETHCKKFNGEFPLMMNQSLGSSIAVNAEIELLEHSRSDLGGVPIYPVPFIGQISIVEGVHSMIHRIDPVELLTLCNSTADMALVIKFANYQHLCASGNEVEWKSLGPKIPTLGASFFDTCKFCIRNVGAYLPPRIIRAILEVVNGLNMKSVHVLRKGEGPNEAQRIRKRDNAKAQRRDIDGEFHLHYWDCPNGSIELASVVYHNDFTIPE